MKNNTGFKRIRMAGVYSFKGLIAAFRHEAAFRQELAFAAVLLPLVFLLDIARLERILLISVSALVLICELLNSAIETVVDRIGTEHHEMSGRAKDIGSAAVLLSLVLWAYVWADIVVFGWWLKH